MFVNQCECIDFVRVGSLLKNNYNKSELKRDKIVECEHVCGLVLFVNLFHGCSVIHIFMDLIGLFYYAVVLQ